MPRVSVRNSWRRLMSHPQPAGAVVHERLRPPLAEREELRDHPEVLLGYIDRDVLHRFVHLAVDDPCDTLRSDGELEGFGAAFCSIRTGELELSTSLNLPTLPAARSEGRGARRCRRAPPWSRFSTCLAVSLSPPLQGGAVLMPTVIDRDGSSTLMTGICCGSSWSTFSVSPIITSGMPGDRREVVSWAGLVGLDLFERLADIPLNDLRALDRPVGATPGHGPGRGGSSPRTSHSASRPTYGDTLRLVTSAWSGWLSPRMCPRSRVEGRGLRSGGRALRDRD